MASEHWTNRFCPRGARIKIRRDPFYVLQQDEPYDDGVEEICCAECEAERG